MNMNTNSTCPPKRGSRPSMAGLSLVELMIAMLISLLLLGGVIKIFGGSKITFLVQEGNSRLQENARFALSKLSEDISAAGYLGCLDSGAPARPIANDLANQAAGSAYDFSTPVSGADGTGVNGSDTISIRRAGADGGIPVVAPMAFKTSDLMLDDSNPLYGRLQPFDLMVVGDCGAAAVFMITNDPAGSGGAIKHEAGVVATSGPNTGQSNASGSLQNIFGAEGASVATATRIGTTTYEICASMSGNGTSLFTNSNNCAAAGEANELVEGVRDMQFLYGIDADGTPGVERYLRADQVGAAQWNQVVAVRMTLVMDTVKDVPGGMATQSFTTTVRLRNRGG